MLRERRPARLGELEQLPVAPRMRLEFVGDVVEQQDEAGEVPAPSASRRAHGRHAHAQEVARRACRSRSAPTASRRRYRGDAPLDGLERMGDQAAVDDAVDRTAEARSARRRPAPLRRAREPAEQLPARARCRAGCGRRGCRPPRSGSARPSARRAGRAAAPRRGSPRPPAAPYLLQAAALARPAH